MNEGRSRVCKKGSVFDGRMNEGDGVGMCCQMRTLSKSLRKWNGFGGDVIAEQPSHPCLGIHNTVCHVTPCVLPSSE